MADGRVTIKTNVEDRSLKDLRSTLKNLEDAFKNLQSVDPFSGISKDARDLMNDFSGVSTSASKAERDIDDIDGKSMEDVSNKASNASSGLEDTAQSADKADASIDGIDGKPLDDVKRKTDDVGKGMDNTEQKTQRFSISLRDIAKSAIVLSAISKAFDVITASLDDAIARFDTLNTFPRTMNLLGYETSVVDRSTRSLVRGIEGLPTKLDSVISTTQRLAGMTGDLDDATETTLALNNAFLASNSSAADAARGTEQYIQMLGNGKPDMQSWRTLQETMNYALIETAKSFEFTGPNALNQFYSALQSGNITFNEFNKRLQELNHAQGGFAELALENSKTLDAAWTNVKTAVSRNLANIIEAIDDLSVALTGRDLYENITNLKYIVDDVFGFAISTIKGLTPVLVATWNGFRSLLEILRPLEPVLWGVVAAFAAFKIINTISAAWTGLTTAIAVAKVALQLFNAVALTSGGGLLTLTGIKAGLAAVLGNVAMNAGVATGAMGSLAGGVTVLKGAIAALSGPIGWVVAGIGALVAGGVAVYNHFIKASEETQALGAALNDAAGETAELNDLVDQTASSYEKTKEATDAQFDSIRMLADETAELAAQEHLSAGEKKILKDNIDELNESVDGLNLTYDEEQQRLVASNDAMLERIRMAEEDAKYNDARERSAQIVEQHDEATKQLTENEKALAEAQEHLDSLPWYQSSGEAKEGVEALKEENARLMAQIQELSGEKQRADAEMAESAQVAAELEAEANQQRITSLEGLPPAQARVIEEMKSRYQDLEQSTTDMFSKIEASSKMSIEEMNENLKHNQEIVANWSENLATLSEQGVDQGMLDQLARLGPEGAPYVQELVDATPEQLAELEENFIKGGVVAKQGLFDSMGIEEGDVIDGIPEMATATAGSLREAFESSGLRKIIPEELEKGKGDAEAAGEDVAKGVSIGIERGAVTAADASKQMAKDINSGFTTELMIKSPSQVFKQHGDDIGEGLTIGIKSSGVRAINAMKILTLELTRTIRDSISIQNRDAQTGYNALVSTIRGQMNRVPPLVRNTMNQSTQSMRHAAGQSQIAGRQLGIGFYNGLNSTAGSIYSLANTIARNAVNQINSALRTRSPSLEGRDSGSNLGKGLWLGMKDELRNVEKWSDELGLKALAGLPRFSPLGMNLQVGMVSGSGGSTNTSSVHNNQKYEFNVSPSGTESNEREFYHRLFREFKHYISEEGGAFNNG